MQDLCEKITEQFILNIISGRWTIDEWLPPERTLAEKYRVGRPTIHTALIRLQEVGLVEIVPRHGAKVKNFLMSGKIGAVEIVIELFKNELTEEMKVSLYKFICDNLTSIVDNCLTAGIKNASVLPALKDSNKDTVLNDKEVFSQAVFNFYHSLSIETGNMIYPLLINSIKNGIKNAASYVKDRKDIYKKLESLEEAIIEGNIEKSHKLNHEILLHVYNDWK